MNFQLHVPAEGILAPFLAHLSLNGTSVALGFLIPHLSPDQSQTIWLIGVAVLALMAAALAQRAWNADRRNGHMRLSIHKQSTA